MQHAFCSIVALFDRRKGYGEHAMDRRRTYVDIMERVLGNDLLSQPPRQPSRFMRKVTFPNAELDTAVTSVEVRVLDGIEDGRDPLIVELKNVRS